MPSDYHLRARYVQSMSGGTHGAPASGVQGGRQESENNQERGPRSHSRDVGLGTMQRSSHFTKRKEVKILQTVTGIRHS
jgi:hypothetical protein